MPGPLTGVRVVEVATWIAVPACGALMADMGASVIKVEPQAGDAWRANRDVRGQVQRWQGNPAFEPDNRGKRGIAVNLDHPAVRDMMLRLVRDADVFMTNLVPARRARYGLTYEAMAAENPRLVYLAFSGYGDQGAERDRLGYDYTSYWSRSGVLDTMAEQGGAPPMPRPAQGDHATASLLLAGVLAALYERDRSGLGQQVSGSLVMSGLWSVTSDLQTTLVTGEAPPRAHREAPGNPLASRYRAADGRWMMLFANRDGFWEAVCRALGMTGVEHDARFTTVAARAANSAALVALLDAAIGRRTLADVGAALDAAGVLWAPIQSLLDVIDDPQLRANDAFITMDHPTYGPFETINTPLAFSRSDVGPQGVAPEVGQHTEEILLEAGFDWDTIARLVASGAVGVNTGAGSN